METGTWISLAWSLLFGPGPAYLEIVGLSLRVTLSAVLAAAVIGLPLGSLLAVTRFHGRGCLIIVVNALMGLPPVVAGLAVFLLFSRSGPLGGLGWLFTPAVMIVAQTILVLPIVVALTRQIVEDLWVEYGEHLRSLDMSGWQTVPTLIWDARFGLMTVLLAGFGRASAEVGSVLIVGGNIVGHTRTMTTAIALEVSKGDLALAMRLGLTLLCLALLVNIAVFAVGRIGKRFAG
jgi:tungstate transport system permease protein